MRIISGQFKGKKIFEPRDYKTRPLRDLVKESIFNILKHSKKLSINIENSTILDLFSGVGSFGLEAISRGSLKVFFVENYPESLKILRRNINNLDVTSRSLVIEKDIHSNLAFETLHTKFDIIFLDPPFKDKNISYLIEKIFYAKILKENGIIVFHRNSKFNDTIFNKFKILEEKKYGLSKIIFGNF